jgi:hypothetical protein
MRAVEARAAVQVLGLVALADDGEGDQAQRDRDGEEVLEDGQRPGLADDRDVEAVGEQVPEGLDDRQEQDDEAPEHEEVRDAGGVPLEQPHLAEHLGGVRHEAAGPVLEPTR